MTNMQNQVYKSFVSFNQFNHFNLIDIYVLFEIDLYTYIHWFEYASGCTPQNWRLRLNGKSGVDGVKTNQLNCKSRSPRVLHTRFPRYRNRHGSVCLRVCHQAFELLVI